MKNRYSILRPLTIEEQEIFAINTCNFFSPLNYRKNCELLKIKLDEKSIKPLSFGSLLKYLKIKTNLDPYKYMRHLDVLIKKFIDKGFFVNAGNTFKGSPPMNHCYYAQFELTNLQSKSLYWLGDVLGEEYLMKKYEPFIVRFEGEYKNGNSGTGSGILINKNTILTCRHNITDLVKYRCFIGDSELQIDNHSYHDKHDIGIVKTLNDLNYGSFPYFGEPYVLDTTLTMGYPPLRGMREAPLISQKGEINALSRDWNNCSCITISSTVRPGNSGGPVISKKGYIVGIVTQYANSATQVSVDKENFIDNKSIPFYNAIASTDIIKILTELDTSIEIAFEDYQ